jgi:hypothetical protein
LALFASGSPIPLAAGGESMDPPGPNETIGIAAAMSALPASILSGEACHNHTLQHLTNNMACSFMNVKREALESLLSSGSANR